MSRFIENQNPSLTVPGASEALKIHVKTTAKVLKSQLHGITVWIRRLVDGTCKCSSRLVGAPQHIENTQYDTLSFCLRHALPWPCSTREYLGCMEFHTVWIRCIYRFCKLIQLLREPVSLCFIDRHPAKDQVVLICISC